MKYKEIAQNIIYDVGGKENIRSLNHCYTRLRFSLNDEAKAQTKDIENLDGVLSVVKSGGEYQVVIGPEVNGVFKAIQDNHMLSEEKLNGGSSSESLNTNKVNEKKNFKYYAGRGLDIFVSCFTPIIPVIAGAGMVKGVGCNITKYEFVKYAFFNFLSIECNR